MADQTSHLQRLIKQTVPFRSELVQAEIGLIYVSYLITHESSGFFKQFGITTQQYNVLRILRGQHPGAANINLIRERMIDRMCDASRIVDRLVRQKLVSKRPNERDKRHADVQITGSGLDMLRLIDQAMEKHHSFLNRLDEGELQQLNQLIDRILEGVPDAV